MYVYLNVRLSVVYSMRECVQVTAASPAFERCILLLCRLCEAKGGEAHTQRQDLLIYSMY